MCLESVPRARARPPLALRHKLGAHHPFDIPVVLLCSRTLGPRDVDLDPGRFGLGQVLKPALRDAPRTKRVAHLFVHRISPSACAGPRARAHRERRTAKPQRSVPKGTLIPLPAPIAPELAHTIEGGWIDQ